MARAIEGFRTSLIEKQSLDAQAQDRATRTSPARRSWPRRRAPSRSRPRALWRRSPLRPSRWRAPPTCSLGCERHDGAHGGGRHGVRAVRRSRQQHRQRCRGAVELRLRDRAARSAHQHDRRGGVAGQRMAWRRRSPSCRGLRPRSALWSGDPHSGQPDKPARAQRDHRSGPGGRSRTRLRVVAAEVKALAGQTALATDRIVGQVEAIQAAAQGTTTAITAIAATIAQMSETATAVAASADDQGKASQRLRAPSRARLRARRPWPRASARCRWQLPPAQLKPARCGERHAGEPGLPTPCRVRSPPSSIGSAQPETARRRCWLCSRRHVPWIVSGLIRPLARYARSRRSAGGGRRPERAAEQVALHLVATF